MEIFLERHGENSRALRKQLDSACGRHLHLKISFSVYIISIVVIEAKAVPLEFLPQTFVFFILRKISPVP